MLHHLGPKLYLKLTVISLMNGSNNSTKKNIARMFHERGDQYDYISKGQINELLVHHLSSVVLELYKYWEAKKSGNGKPLM